MTPAESEFLLCIAALSLSFVGFSAIVVTLRGALGGDLSARHIRLVRLYIEGGLIVTALALLPALLNVLQVPAGTIWRVSSAAAAAAFAGFLLMQSRRRRAVEPGAFPRWVVVINLVSGLALVGLLLNMVGMPFAPGAGVYAVVLAWALCIFGFIFVRTIELFLHRPPQD